MLALAPARRTIRPGGHTTPRPHTRRPPLLAAATLAAAFAWTAARSSRSLAVAASPDSNSPPAPSWDGTAVVIVDHGSRRAASNAQLDEVVVMYK